MSPLQAIPLGSCLGRLIFVESRVSVRDGSAKDIVTKDRISGFRQIGEPTEYPCRPWVRRSHRPGQGRRAGGDSTVRLDLRRGAGAAHFVSANLGAGRGPECHTGRTGGSDRRRGQRWRRRQPDRPRTGGGQPLPCDRSRLRVGGAQASDGVAACRPDASHRVRWTCYCHIFDYCHILVDQPIIVTPREGLGWTLLNAIRGDDIGVSLGLPCPRSSSERAVRWP